MDPLSTRVAAKFLAVCEERINIATPCGVVPMCSDGTPVKTDGTVVTADEGPNLPRLERIVASIEKEAKEMRYSLDKYKSDPAKYKPQLENVEHAAGIIESDLRVLRRTLGKE